MKNQKYLTLLAVLLFNHAFANGYETIVYGSTKNNNPVLSTDTTTNDTIELLIKNNDKLDIPITNDRVTKVILAKEKSKFDFLGYLLPILTLLLGIWIKEYLDKENESKKIKKSGERWIAELRSLEEPLKKQIQTLKEFKEEHEKEEFNIPTIKFYSALNGEVFKSLDKNELIQFIEINNKKSAFEDIVLISNQTHGFTSILIHLHDSLKEKFNKFLNETSKYVDALNSSLQSFGVAFADYGVELEMELKADPSGDKRYKPLADLYSDYIIPHLEDGKFNPYELKQEFFLPTLKILSQNRFDPRIKPMLIAVNAALNAIKGIEMEKHYMTKIINKMIGYYEKQLEDLEVVVKKINK